MAELLPIDQFLAQSANSPVIDVRSPDEFAQGHIPGAVNIPLFDNKERAIVGTKYKQVGRDAAVLTGLELIGPKLAAFVKQARQIAPQGEVLVHCWRGGMRSASFAWLLQTAGLQVNGTLQGGYKAFRQAVLSFFENHFQLIVLGGKTGSGKTEILHALQQAGEQVIDLERLAQHKGSSFGAIGEAPQPSVEHFENNLFAALRSLDVTRRIWLEDEGSAIGTVRIPRPFFMQMRQAPVFFLEVSKEERIKRLVRIYTGSDDKLLAEALERIQKRLGGQHYQRAKEALAAKDYYTVADMALTYYDKTYVFELAQRNPTTIHQLKIAESNSSSTLAEQLVTFANTVTPSSSASA